MSGAVPLLTLYVFMVCIGTALLLPLSINYYLFSPPLLPFNGEIIWKPFFFNVLLTVRLSIILVTDQLNAKILVL